VWLERAHGPVETVLSHRQIVALAGEFYREMIATHGDEPVSAEKWQDVIDRDKQRKEEALKRTPPLFSFPKQVFVRSAFQDEVNEFLKSRGLNLKGAKLDSFVDAYLGAKKQAAQQLQKYANKNYKEDEGADRFGDPKVLTDNGKVAAMEMFNPSSTARHACHGAIDPIPDQISRVRRPCPSDGAPGESMEGQVARHQETPEERQAGEKAGGIPRP
jgi:hypothetical protein